jgi:hypothetical protein
MNTENTEQTLTGIIFVTTIKKPLEPAATKKIGNFHF